ncbi:hypothetical protein DFJ73DRAFT_768270 [Zopfochytrium polystomum]|nr:hypothetical protein DFJ73DRAFT_768270 [Zopfochytrium polystomum]
MTKDNAIHLPLWDILELDTEKRTVKVEPGVSIGQLTRFPHSQRMAPPTKYGLFNDIVVSADVIVGKRTRSSHCSATENADLFRALPWSYGGAGFAVMIELRIIPVKKYCRLVYEPVSRVDDMVKRFSELAEAPDPPEWFHRHAELLSKNPHPTVEYVPLRDYFHRHTRSIYWICDNIVPMGNHPIFRYTLGWLMPPSVNFLKLTQTEGMKDFYFDKHVSQDYLVPLDKMKEGLDLAHQAFEVYPVWLCPHAVLKTTPQGAIRARKTAPRSSTIRDVAAQEPRVPGHVRITEMNEAEFLEMFDMSLYQVVETHRERTLSARSTAAKACSWTQRKSAEPAQSPVKKKVVRTQYQNLGGLCKREAPV